jgi:hypothetical protein
LRAAAFEAAVYSHFHHAPVQEYRAHTLKDMLRRRASP